MYDMLSIASFSTERENVPCESVVVPETVPSMMILTPVRGWPDSESVIIPTFTLWDNRKLGMRK